MPETFAHFDAADYLETDEEIAAYLEASAEYGDAATMAAALATVARARNLTRVAGETGMTREGIDRALSAGGNPAFSTVVEVAKALGFGIAFKAAKQA